MPGTEAALLCGISPHAGALLAALDSLEEEDGCEGNAFYSLQVSTPSLNYRCALRCGTLSELWGPGTSVRCSCGRGTLCSAQRWRYWLLLACRRVSTTAARPMPTPSRQRRTPMAQVGWHLQAAMA